MSYIDKNLLPDEKIVFRTKKHKIIFLTPVILLVLAIIATDYMQANPILVNFLWAPWVVAFIYWSYISIEYFTSDFVVTNKRVMMREGFFVRHTNEMRLSSISQVNVDQSLLGQILNYGIVSINAFGAFDRFPIVSRPFAFQQSVNQQIDKAR
jgi:uncharacterized membrane protein YdbT with pleckstrin-like domain